MSLQWKDTIFLGNGLLSVKIQIHQPFGRGDIQGFVFPVNFGDELLGGGDEDFGSVMVNLHQRIVGEFHEILASADFAQAVVNDFKANHFVEIEPVAGEFRQAAKRRCRDIAVSQSYRGAFPPRFR